MSSEILFITGNQKKVSQANEALGQFNITAAAQDAPVDEIQHHDPEQISLD